MYLPSSVVVPPPAEGMVLTYLPVSMSRLPAGVSVGACPYPEGASDELELRERADLRMYEAKRAGGNRYVL